MSKTPTRFRLTDQQISAIEKRQPQIHRSDIAKAIEEAVRLDFVRETPHGTPHSPTPKPQQTLAERFDTWTVAPKSFSDEYAEALHIEVIAALHSLAGKAVLTDERIKSAADDYARAKRRLSAGYAFGEGAKFGRDFRAPMGPREEVEAVSDQFNTAQETYRRS